MPAIDAAYAHPARKIDSASTRLMWRSSTVLETAPLEKRMELCDGAKEIVPGIHAIPAPGHTPGHIALFISSANSHLLHISDSVLNPLHMENPDWRSVFDLDSESAANTRRGLLDRAAADKVSSLAYHFPFPGIGRVESKGNAWTWKAGTDPSIRAA